MTEGFIIWVTVFQVKWVPNKQTPASDYANINCDCFQESYKPKKWICAKRQYGKSKRISRFKFCGQIDENQGQLTSENQLYWMKDVAVRIILVKHFENTNPKIDFKITRLVLWVLGPTLADFTAKNIPVLCMDDVAKIKEKLVFSQRKFKF